MHADLKKAFDKYDKKKTGSIKPSEIADVFRMAGQNPTVEEVTKMIEEAEAPGWFKTKFVLFNNFI